MQIDSENPFLLAIKRKFKDFVIEKLYYGKIIQIFVVVGVGVFRRD